MTAHVFIVDDTTFPLHLQHQFAGTGAKKEARIDFNNSATTKKKHQTEDILVRMIADVNCVRKGDRVLFYLLNSKKDEGRFYGIFRAREDAAFLDNSDNKQFLRGALKKSLTFRVLIEPEKVYPKGITEWLALDEIRNIAKPHQMLWSLIYRKLRGHRGCTPITHYEEERLCSLIRGEQRPLRGGAFSFDPQSREIVACGNSAPVYRGAKESFFIMPRLLEKARNKRQFESHLQAHIAGQIGRESDPLTQILMKGKCPEWVGSEIGCGVGMQRIDIMTSRRGRHQHLTLIELKSKRASVINIRQIRRYVDWAEQYYIPNSPAIIEPVLIAQKTPGKLSADFVRAAAEFDEDNAGKTCAKLRLVEFEISEKQIHYQERKIGN